MKRSAPYFLLLVAFLAAAPTPVKAAKPPQFNTIVVKHFVNANGVNQSQEFANAFSESIRAELQKDKIAGQTFAEDGTVADAAAANSLSIEGKFTSLDKGSKIKLSKLGMEIDIYRISDHALVKTITGKATYSSWPITPDEDNDIGEITGKQAAHQIKQALKDINLSSIPAGPPVPRPVAPAPASATVPAVPQVFASVQISSNPAGAEITIDGNYAGNTPSLIKLRPGTHSIRITKDGYAPWERSIDAGAGESRNVAATLEKTGP